MANCSSTLNVANDAELLSYIINQDPVLKAELPLPKQGESIKPYGELISSNERFRNAFVNICNLIGLTVIKRNAWADPWDFTERGTIRWGQSVREIILDLVKAHDYNAVLDTPQYALANYVPNAFQYIHDINFQKFYCSTTSDDQLAMAFDSEGGLFDFIDAVISMNYESFVYDRYQINKYMLARRILNGTVTPSYISGYSGMTPRQRTASMKAVSNKMAFRSPNYNPAGLRKATSFDDQILIMSTDFEADFSTDVMATSFFRDEADFRARLRLVDGFGNLDDERLTETLGNAYTPLEESEVTALNAIPAVLISREWFMDYSYAFNTDSGMRETEFFNPMTLRNNHFLHAWECFSTSPFENATVFTATAPSITSVTVSPSTANALEGSKVVLGATVVTAGYANQAVEWEVTTGDTYATVSADGVVSIKSDIDFNGSASVTVVVTATSIFDDNEDGSCTITVIDPDYTP